MQIYWKKKEGSNVRKNVTSAGAVVWDTNMAMVLLFCDANITNLAFLIGLY